MILAIDIGNTTVKYGGLEKQGKGWKICFCAHMDTTPVRYAEEYLAQMRAGLARLAPNAHFEGAVLVSVVPKAEEPLASCAHTITGHAPLRVTWHNCGLKVLVDNPAAVGRDRFVDAAWAAANLPLPAVTVDMGTATTFNVISKNREFLGGIISPGMATALNALSAKAAQLPPIDLVTPKKIIGTNTLDCMLSGAVAGSAAMVDGLVQRIEEELGSPVSLIITGGHAHYIMPLLKHSCIFDENLLLQGLGLLYEQNTAL